MIFDILEKLCKIPTSPGMESGILSYIEENFADNLDTSYDGMGNLVVLKRCGKPNARKIMVSTKADADGFIVNYIEENGYIRVTKLGNPSTVSCAYGRLVSDSGVCGFIVPEKGAEVKEGDASKLYVDIGACSREDAQKLVKLGDIFAVIPELCTLTDGKKGGRGVASRLPLAVVLELLKNAESETSDIYFSFNVQESLMYRGAKTSAFDICPDVCISVDICESFDTVGAENKGQAVLGDGAVIIAKSSDYCMPLQLREKITNTANEYGIKFKTCIYTDKATASSKISACSVGVECAEICIPARNVATGAEIIDTSDAESVYNLISKLIV